MTTVSRITGSSHELAEEDRLRAQFYDLLAQYLSSPPSADRLVAAGRLSGGETALGQAIERFALVAGRCDPGTADDEYNDLFIGIGRGELLPYASYYLTGFLHEKPLARLRGDMTALGIAANPEATEPEDHAAMGHDAGAMDHEGAQGHAAEMDHSGMDHSLMPGMLTPEQMQQLADASGVEFDRLFLEFMIAHHEGALFMVEELFSTPGGGQESWTNQFAGDVDADQEMEIQRMQQMLNEIP